MGYVIGQPYKRVIGIRRDGSPVYEMTTVVAVHPDKLVLANGTIIDYVSDLPGSGADLSAGMQTKLRPRPR